MGEITPINGLDHDLQGLTCIPLRIHCAATPDTDEELSELDRMAIDTFIDELADIAVSIINVVDSSVSVIAEEDVTWSYRLHLPCISKADPKPLALAAAEIIE